MVGILSNLLAGASLALRQPLSAFCDVETTHGEHLVSKRGDYISMLRIDGLRRMCTRKEIEALAEQQRIELQGLLEERGHAIVGWYISDPERSGIEIDRLCLDACRTITQQLGADLDDVLNERGRRWPTVMRWEATYYVLWTRPSVLTREERKQAAEERKALAKAFPRVGDSQRFALRSEVMAARHESFIARVQSALRDLDIATEFLSPHAALRVSREALYRETAGSRWKPTLMGDRVMPRLPDVDEPNPHPGNMLWPAIRDQMFNADAETKGGQLVAVGDYTYAPVDMMVGPEDPRPFAELSATLGKKRVPWRSAVILEGGGKAAFGIKEAGAGFLSMFPGNGDIRRAFAALHEQRKVNNHNAVRMRMTATTWAPIGEEPRLRRQASDLAQALEAWGNCRATRISGDPLEAAMGSVPGLALGSTATPSLALLGDALAMMPWARSASPYRSGSIIFRKPDGSIWPYDPAGAALRPAVVDIIVAPPGGGKSVLSNTILLGLLLSSASMSTNGTKLPFIGKLDIGPSSQGLVDMLRNALGRSREHLAVFVKMQTRPGFEVNVFDTQLGLEYPLQLERVFQQNFVSLLATPLEGAPWEGMDHLIEDVIDEAYRLCTGVPGGMPKVYTAGVEPEVDAAIARLAIQLPHHDGDGEDPTWWRDVVTALIARGEHRLAGFAQRHAVPLLQDLLSAARSPEIEKRYSRIVLPTQETLIDTFDRYIMNAIKNFPTLAAPTKLDLGDARIIILDLADVAPQGSPAANRQTALMYMLGRHLLARNFFLHPDDADSPAMPAVMREYHLARFTEMKETVKRVDFDEWHRAASAPAVDRQAVRDGREGRKHNVQLGFISQNHTDFSEDLYKVSTARWILKCGDQETADSLIARFKLSPASAYIVRNSLPGPGKNGAPFLLEMVAGEAKYEQLLINVLGPIELWSFSTTPTNTALRSRLFQRTHFARALRMLAIVFPSGSAESEIDRRKEVRLTRGGASADEAEDSVLDELANEIIDGRGVAAGLYDTLRAMDGEDGFAMAAE